MCSASPQKRLNMSLKTRRKGALKVMENFLNMFSNTYGNPVVYFIVCIACPAAVFSAVIGAYTSMMMMIIMMMFNLNFLCSCLHGPAPCGLWGCKNRPSLFPGRMSYKVTKPGSFCHISAVFIVLLFIRAPFGCSG